MSNRARRSARFGNVGILEKPVLKKDSLVKPKLKNPIFGSFSAWILDTNFWSDNGAWRDTETWND